MQAAGRVGARDALAIGATRRVGDDDARDRRPRGATRAGSASTNARPDRDVVRLGGRDAHDALVAQRGVDRAARHGREGVGVDGEPHGGAR